MKYRTSAAFLFTLAIAAAAAAQSDSAAKPAGTDVGDYTMQVTGSVVSSEANRLVVKNDRGQEMVFIITDKQVDASLFHPGDRVTASYVTLAGTGVAVTKVVAVPAEVTPTVTTNTPTPAETTVTTPRTAPYPSATPAPAVAPMRTTTAPLAADSYDQGNTQATRTLPATASPMPLVALLGLLGAAGAATIRRFRLS